MDETRPLPDFSEPAPERQDCLFVDGMAVPRRFDDLLVLNTIGVGGFGVVVLAERREPRGRVAVKFPRISRLEAGSIDKFRDEADKLSGLQSHPGIIAVYKTGTFRCDGFTLPYMVMELVDPPLRLMEFISTHSLDEYARCQLILKVARAVEHMHDRGMWHRDLKPANVLVQGKGQPKIIDVGMAITGDPTKRAQEFGLVSGTPEYMAPEQFEATPNALTARTDVYALGVLLHEVLTGRLPIAMDGASTPDKMRLVRSSDPTSPSSFVSLKHPALDSVVSKALRKELHPDDPSRQHGPREFADELEDCLTERRSGNSANGQRTREFALRLAIAAVLVLVIGLLGDRPARWSGLDRWYEHQLMSTPMPAVRNLRTDRVAVIHFATDDEPKRVADQLGIQGVALDDPKTYRALWPPLLDALQKCGIAGVGLDIAFRKAQTPFDDRLCEVAATYQNADPPIPLFCGFDMWCFTLNLDTFHPKITAAIPMAGVSLDEGDGRCAWTVDVALQRGGRVAWGGLASAALPSMYGPSYDSSLTIERDPPALRIDFSSRNAGGASVPTATIRTERFPVSLVDLEFPAKDEAAEHGLQDNDVVAKIKLAMPPRSVLDGISYSYAKVIQATDTERRDWFRGKVIFVANTSKAGRASLDLFPTAHGDEVWGVYGHALALQAMLSGEFLRTPSKAVVWPLLLITGAAGALIGVRSTRRVRLPTRRGEFAAFMKPAAVVGIIALLISIVCFFVARHSLVVISPVPLLMTLLVCALSFLIRRRPIQSGVSAATSAQRNPR